MYPVSSFIAERVGSHRPHPVPSRSPTTLDPAPFFWRGPAEGGWPHRRWWLQIITLRTRTMKTYSSVPAPAGTQKAHRNPPTPRGVVPFLFAFLEEASVYLLCCLLLTKVKGSRFLTKRLLCRRVSAMESTRGLDENKGIIGHFGPFSPKIANLRALSREFSADPFAWELQDLYCQTRPEGCSPPTC